MANVGVVRIKRPLNEDPSEALMVVCKKSKTDTAVSEAPKSAVLKFVATLNNPDEDPWEHVRNSTAKTEKQYLQAFKTHTPNISEKLKQDTQDNSKKNRYKIINCYRSGKPNLNNSEDNTNVDADAYTVFDIEYEEYGEKQSSSSSKEPQYVYDLYYTNSDHLEDTSYNDVSIYPVSDHLVFGTPRDNGYTDESEDSDDSNDENNWRNDYPDESDPESIGDSHLADSLRKWDLGSELSSDEGEEKYVYDDYDEEDYDREMVESEKEKYGEMYARFKAKVRTFEKKKVYDPDHYYSDTDSESDVGV